MSCCNTKINNEKNEETNKDSLMDSIKKNQCPKCGNNGSNVKIITLKSLLKDPIKKKIISNFTYNFCKNIDCNIVYFSKDKSHYFLKEQLKLKATLKDKSLDVFVCYCFKYTRQNVLDQLKITGNSTIIESIKSKMKEPGCFCETSNPQGACCLANNRAWLEEARQIINNKN